jgi:transketolase N-terminal domain/subunit
MNTQELVIKNRPNAINMVNKGSSAYIESVPPIVDILAVLHRKVIGYDAQNLKLETRDRFILSKAHAGIGEYITLVEVGVKDKYIATFYIQYLENKAVWLNYQQIIILCQFYDCLNIE